MAATKQWMPRDRWEALVHGVDCPLCEVVRATEPEDAYGHFVAYLSSGRVRLAADQHLPGYCLLISKKHVREPHELEATERAAFFDDMVRVGAALEHVYGALKVNYQILGNSVPHLHCHIQARYYGDPYPDMPPQRSDELQVSSAAEDRRRIVEIRAALAGADWGNQAKK
jgi:diadenosine tetraphosphate (Ap4A) HIT family hydrolase